MLYYCAKLNQEFVIVKNITAFGYDIQMWCTWICIQLFFFMDLFIYFQKADVSSKSTSNSIQTEPQTP